MSIVTTGDSDMATRWDPAQSLPLAVKGTAGDRRVAIGGTWACRSRWGCFRCADIETARSAAECAGVVDLHRSRNGAVAFLTGTFPHDYGDGLQRTYDAAAGAWRSHRQGRRPTMLLEKYGYIGSIRAVDLTHGANGWHPHVHALILLETELTDDEMAALESDLYKDWNRYMRKAGFRDVDAYRFRVERPRSAKHVAEYVSEISGHKPDALAREVVGTGTKTGREGRTIMELYRDAATGDEGARALVREMEAVLPRRKLLTWSKYAQELRAEVTAPDPEDIEEPPDDAEETPRAPLLYLPVWFYLAARQIPGAVETVLAWGAAAIRDMDLGGPRQYRADAFGKPVLVLPPGPLWELQRELDGKRYEYNRLFGRAPSNPHSHVRTLIDKCQRLGSPTMRQSVGAMSGGGM